MNDKNSQGSMSIEQLSQPGPSSMDDLAALLGLMTTLGEQHHMAMQPQQPQDASQRPQNAPQQAQEPQPTQEAPKAPTPALDKIKGARQQEPPKDIASKLDDIETQLKQLLADEDAEKKQENGPQDKNTEPTQQDSAA